MKNVLAWIKVHLTVVICSAVILLSLSASATLYFLYGDTWRDEQEKQVNAELKRVEEARVTYALPAVDTAPPITLKQPANKKVTDWFVDAKKKVNSAVESVVKAADDFNRGSGAAFAAVGRLEHKPLVDDLFPAPKSEIEGQVSRIKFANLIVGTREAPSVYAKLLQSIRAGNGYDGAQMGQRLKDVHASEWSRIAGDKSQRQPTKDEQELLTKKLVETRRALYLERASSISVYATADIFPYSGAGTGGTTIPREVPPKAPTVSECFLWQMDYWLAQDLLAAVRLANTNPRTGQLVNVDQSLVKRIDRITFGRSILARGGTPGPDGAAPPATPIESLAGLVPTDLNLSLTGRKNDAANPMYDVRTAEVSLVVSASRLPELFDAFAATNFMTVVGLTLSEVDPWTDLEQGYYYGDESVVRAQIQVETVWLRSWTVPLMPPTVLKFLGLPIPEALKDKEDKDFKPDPSEVQSASGPGGNENIPTPLNTKGGRGGRGGE